MESIAKRQFMMQIKENALYPNQLADIVQNILESPPILTFSEFLELVEIQQLEFSEFKPYFEALKIFAVGTLRQYSENFSELIPLTDKMEKKLKLLTLLTMATVSKSIPYSELLNELNFFDVCRLEELIIEAVYAGLIVGKMDHKERRLEIDSAAARDLQPQDIPSMIETFEQWLQATAETANCIKELIAKSGAEKNENAKLKLIKQTNEAMFARRVAIGQRSPGNDEEHTDKVAKRRFDMRTRAGPSREADSSNSVSSTSSPWSFRNYF